MKAKIRLGLLAAALITLALIVSVGLLSPPYVVAQAPTPAAAVPAQEPLLIRFTTSVSPVFEGGAVGAPVPFTIEIRAKGLANQDLALVQKELPEKVKSAL